MQGEEEMMMRKYYAIMSEHGKVKKVYVFLNSTSVLSSADLNPQGLDQVLISVFCWSLVHLFFLICENPLNHR